MMSRVAFQITEGSQSYTVTFEGTGGDAPSNTAISLASIPLGLNAVAL